MKSEIVKRLLERIREPFTSNKDPGYRIGWHDGITYAINSLAEDALLVSGVDEEMGFHFSHKPTSYDNKTCVALDFRPIQKGVTKDELLSYLDACEEPWAGRLKERIKAEGIIP